MKAEWTRNSIGGHHEPRGAILLDATVAHSASARKALKKRAMDYKKYTNKHIHVRKETSIVSMYKSTYMYTILVIVCETAGLEAVSTQQHIDVRCSQRWV